MGEEVKDFWLFRKYDTYGPGSLDDSVELNLKSLPLVSV